MASFELHNRLPANIRATFCLSKSYCRVTAYFVDRHDLTAQRASVIPKRYLTYVCRLRGLQDLLLVECNPLFYTVHHIFAATMRNRKARSVGGSVESLKHHRVFIYTVVFRELTSQSLIRQV